MPQSDQNVYALQSMQDLLAQRMKEKLERERIAREQAQQQFENARSLGQDRRQERLDTSAEDARKQTAAREGLRLVGMPKRGAALDPETMGMLRSAGLGHLVQADTQLPPRRQDVGGAGIVPGQQKTMYRDFEIPSRGPSEPGQTLPSTQLSPAIGPTFRGTQAQTEDDELRAELDAFIVDSNFSPEEKQFIKARVKFGETLPWQLFGEQKPTGEDYKEVGGYIYRRDASGNWVNTKEKALDPAQQQRNYYTLQPVYDPQGRPIGGFVFDTRTGNIVKQVGPGDLNNGQLKPPPGNLGVQTIAAEASLDALERLKTMYDVVGSKGGPLEGRLRSAGQQVGIVDQPVPMPGGGMVSFSDFKAATSAFRNSVIKAITGAQMSEPEARRIMQQIPSENDAPQVWMAKYEQTRKNMQDLENRTRTDRGTGQPESPSGVEYERGPDGRLRVKQ